MGKSKAPKRLQAEGAAATPSKKQKKAEEPIKVEKAVVAAPQTPAKKDKKKNKENVVSVKVEEMEEKLVVEAKKDKKNKKKNAKDATKAVVAAAPAAAAEADAYVPGALTALFGGAAPAGPTAAKDDIFAKYEGGDSGFVDIPTVIETPVKKEKENTREKQRVNRKKNADERGLVDERKRTVFVGNLPVEFTPKALQKLFADCGKIDSVRIRGTIGSKETLSKKTAFLAGKLNENIKSIVGYVKFVSPDTVAEAIKKNGQLIDGHHIHVDRCVDIKNYDRKATIFVGNLPFEISDDEVYEWAEENVGEVEFVRVVRDKNTGYGRGIGFITFKDHTSLEKALALKDPKIGENVIRLTKVMKKKEKKDVLKRKMEKGKLRKARTTERKKKAKEGGGKKSETEGGLVNPLMVTSGGSSGAKKPHPSKKIQKEIKKRRKMAGPKSLMK